MKRIIYILLLAMGMATVAPLASVVDNSVAALYAVDAKAKAKAQREKEKAKKAKEREKAKAKAAKEREKAAAQKKKEQARAQAAKQKQRQQAQSQQAKAQPSKAQQAKPASAAVAKSSTGNNLSAAEEKEQYLEQIAAIDKANAKANAYNERDIAHRLGFWGLVGYSNLFTSGINYQAPAAEGLNPTGFKNKDKGFVGGGFGLGYQLRYRQFLMTVGAEFTFYNSVMGIYNQDNGSFALSYGMQPYGDKMTYNYLFNPLNDKLIGGFAQIPLLFGMELKKVPLFWQAGIKASMGVMGKSTLSGTFTTTIEDKELIAGMTDMYNHTLVTDQKIAAPSTNVKFGLNMAASAEVGVNLDQWVNAMPKLRVSLFADYGFLNSLSYKPVDNAQDIPTRMLEDANPLNFPVNSALATTSAVNCRDTRNIRSPIRRLLRRVWVSLCMMSRRLLPSMVQRSRLPMSRPARLCRKIPTVKASCRDVSLPVNTVSRLPRMAISRLIQLSGRSRSLRSIPSVCRWSVFLRRLSTRFV